MTTATATRKKPAKKAKPKKTPATTTDPQAAMFAALGYVAGKEGNRDALADDSRTRVKLNVSGEVGRRKVRHAIDGHLLVGGQQPATKTSSLDAEGLVALLLDTMSGPKRAEFIKKTRRHYSKNRRLPSVSDERKGEAATLIEALRKTTDTTKRGSVTFEHADA